MRPRAGSGDPSLPTPVAEAARPAQERLRKGTEVSVREAQKAGRKRPEQLRLRADGRRPEVVGSRAEDGEPKREHPSKGSEEPDRRGSLAGEEDSSRTLPSDERQGPGLADACRGSIKPGSERSGVDRAEASRVQLRGKVDGPGCSTSGTEGMKPHLPSPQQRKVNTAGYFKNSSRVQGKLKSEAMAEN